jgi:hypothetical protein
MLVNVSRVVDWCVRRGLRRVVRQWGWCVMLSKSFLLLVGATLLGPAVGVGLFVAMHAL